MTETSRDAGHDEDVMAQSMFGTLCPLEGLARGVLLSLLSDGLPEVPIVGDNCGKGRRGGSVTDKTTTDGVRTMGTMEWRIHRRRQQLHTRQHADKNITGSTIIKSTSYA